MDEPNAHDREKYVSRGFPIADAEAAASAIAREDLDDSAIESQRTASTQRGNSPE